MPEPIDLTNELATLRQTVAELTAKNTARKARVVELEASVQTLQANLTGAHAALYQAEVGEPLQTFANAVSPMPELFLSEFVRLGYKVVKTNGKLVLMQNDAAVEGVEFTVEAVTKLLTKSDDPALRNFKHLMIASRASGGGAAGIGGSGNLYPEPKTPPVATPKQHFGLK